MTIAKQVLQFAHDRGGYVNKSMIWGVPSGYFYLDNDVFIAGGDIFMTFYAGAGCGRPKITTSVFYLNNHKIRVTDGGGKVEIVGSVSPNFVNLKYNSRLIGIYSNINSAIADAQIGETIYISVDTHTVNTTITIPAGITLQIEDGDNVTFEQGLTINGTLKTTGTEQNKVELYFGSSASLIINNSFTTSFQNLSNHFTGYVSQNNIFKCIDHFIVGDATSFINDGRQFQQKI